MIVDYFAIMTFYISDDGNPDCSIKEYGNKKMNIALWVVQGLLALAFLFAGFSKACLPLTTIKMRVRSYRIFRPISLPLCTRVW